jgi:hypothetical protein
MSTLIEQAMQRLERLRGAGVSPPGPVQQERRPSRPVEARAEPRSESPQGGLRPGRTSKAVVLSAEAMAGARVFPPGAGPANQASQFRMMKRPLIKKGRCGRI